MLFKITLWMFAIMFVSMMYNVVSAYSDMGEVNVQSKFQDIGLLNDGKSEFPLPPKKPENLMAAL